LAIRTSSPTSQALTRFVDILERVLWATVTSSIRTVCPITVVYGHSLSPLSSSSVVSIPQCIGYPHSQSQYSHHSSDSTRQIDRSPISGSGVVQYPHELVRWLSPDTPSVSLRCGPCLSAQIFRVGLLQCLLLCGGRSQYAPPGHLLCSYVPCHITQAINVPATTTERLPVNRT